MISDRFEIEAWTKFTFPGRQGKYSEFIWDHRCFTGIDWANDINENGIFSILNEYGDGWEELTEEELLQITKGGLQEAVQLFCDRLPAFHAGCSWPCPLVQGLSEPLPIPSERPAERVAALERLRRARLTRR